jgi:hypothetical protein
MTNKPRQRGETDVTRTVVALDNVARIAGAIVLETPAKPRHATVYVSAALIRKLAAALNGAGYNMTAARQRFKQTQATSGEILPHDLELFAINTGELYPHQIALARAATPGRQPDLEPWKRHIHGRVLPLYRRDVAAEPGQRIYWASNETVRTVAQNLADYYARALQEFKT